MKYSILSNPEPMSLLTYFISIIPSRGFCHNVPKAIEFRSGSKSRKTVDPPKLNFHIMSRCSINGHHYELIRWLYFAQNFGKLSVIFLSCNLMSWAYPVQIFRLVKAPFHPMKRNPNHLSTIPCKPVKHIIIFMESNDLFDITSERFRLMRINKTLQIFQNLNFFIRGVSFIGLEDLTLFFYCA